MLLPMIGMGSDDLIKIQQLFVDSQNLSPQEKIPFFSSYFIGSRAELGPLGEGNEDLYDRDPLYSLTVFDCTTFVETVMALSLSENIDDFLPNLIKIRYENGKISFKNRNHFISLDWIPNNTVSGFLKDVTSEIGPAQVANAIIDKKNWYKKLNLSNIKGRDDLSQEDKLVLLESLRSLGEDFTPLSAKILFIDLNLIFKNPKILNSIPNGAIISIIKPNWDLTSTIGTHLNVSHQGIAIWKDGSLFYRHASLEFEKVMDAPFLKYLEKYMINSGTVGINIQKILIK